LLGGALGAAGSYFGGQQQANAQREAAQLALNQSAPWRDAGARMLSTYEGAVNQPFQNTPGYQFALNEGLRSVDRGAAARGLYGSGARARESMRYSTGLADQTYQNWLARLAGGAQIGQAAVGQALPIAAGGIGNAGTAQGASIIGAGNAATGTLNNLALRSMLRPQGQQSSGWSLF
jgi:hypothetical protein